MVREEADFIPFLVRRMTELMPAAVIFQHAGG